MNLQEFQSQLSILLAESGSSLSEQRVRYHARATLREIREDNETHGCPANAPFFDLIISADVAVFTFFDAGLSIYVVPCVEMELILQMNRFAMAETEALRELLSLQYHKCAPDLLLGPTLMEEWLA